MKKVLLKIFLISAILLILIGSFLVLFQDSFILPAHYLPIGNEPVNENFKTVLLPSETGVLEVWKFSPKDSTSKKIAISFIGNGDILPRKNILIPWLLRQGYTIYAFNYRGVGKSSGTLLESGFYQDALKLVDYVSKEEHVDPQDIFITGYSFGTGFAFYTAQAIQAKRLLVLAPYLSIRDVVYDNWSKFLVPFVKTNIPSYENIQKLHNTCVVIAHGKKDTVIPYSHSKKLVDSYHGDGEVIFVSSDTANHYNLINVLNDDLVKAVKKCENTINK